MIGADAESVYFRSKTPTWIDETQRTAKFGSNAYTKVYCPSTSSKCTIDCGKEEEYMSIPQFDGSLCDNIVIFSKHGGM